MRVEVAQGEATKVTVRVLNELIASASWTWSKSLGVAGLSAAGGSGLVLWLFGKYTCCSKQAAAECTEGGWQPATPREAEEEEKPGGCTAAVFGFLALPALLGSWCWPVLIMPMLFGSEAVASESSRIVSHSMMFGLFLGMFTTLLVLIYMRTPEQRAKHGWVRQWAPFWVLLLGSFLVMVDPTRHLLLDQNVAVDKLRMYDPWTGELTKAGKCGMYSTWVGFLLIILGMWAYNDHVPFYEHLPSWPARAGEKPPAATPSAPTAAS